MRNSALLAIALLLTCTKPMPPPPASEPYTGPRAILPDGFPVRIEIAADDDTRAQGLMFRDRVPEGTGMLFVFAQPGDFPFWMKNTLIPLDMIWIDDQNRVRSRRGQCAALQKADPCPNYPPHAVAKYVLELGGGQAASHRVTNGSTLKFERLENVVVR